MSEQYKCKGCGEFFDIDDLECNCGAHFEKLRWTKGGDGSHWEGCEDVHWDCKIVALTARIAELKEILIKKDIYINALENEPIRSMSVIRRLRTQTGMDDLPDVLK